MGSVTWRVVTPSTVDEIMEDLVEEGQRQVLIGMTPSDYERLSMDLIDLISLINRYRSILIQYQTYYEGGTRPDLDP